MDLNLNREKNSPDAIDKNKYDKWLYEQEHTAFFEGSFESLLSGTFSMALLDSGFRKTVCGEAGLESYKQSLSFDEYKERKYHKSNIIFTFI